MMVKLTLCKGVLKLRDEKREGRSVQVEDLMSKEVEFFLVLVQKNGTQAHLRTASGILIASPLGAYLFFCHFLITS